MTPQQDICCWFKLVDIRKFAAYRRLNGGFRMAYMVVKENHELARVHFLRASLLFQQRRGERESGAFNSGSIHLMAQWSDFVKY